MYCSFLKLVLASCLVTLITSCSKLNMYTTDAPNWKDSLLTVEEYRPTIQVDDKISVSIWDHTDLSVGSVYGIYNSNEVFGKWLLVSIDSTVTLPKVGVVKIGGKNIGEAQLLLAELYAEHIVNPILDIKIHNHQVTVIGQVIKPGNYSIYKGKNNLAYLIAEAGGTDFYAKLQRVTLARGDQTHILDLTKMTPIEMNRLNLLPGDVLYFPTKRGKSTDKKAPAVLAAASIFTTIVLLFSTISK